MWISCDISKPAWGLGGVTQMTIESIADVDTEIINARWRMWHGGWEDNADQVDLAKAAIDLLLERRYELMRAAKTVA
jgi:hypothetical protein